MVFMMVVTALAALALCLCKPVSTSCERAYATGQLVEATCSTIFEGDMRSAVTSRNAGLEEVS
jgi:hypothetical protein